MGVVAPGEKNPSIMSHNGMASTKILIKLCALAGSDCNNCAYVGFTKVPGPS